MDKASSIAFQLRKFALAQFLVGGHNCESRQKVRTRISELRFGNVGLELLILWPTEKAFHGKHGGNSYDFYHNAVSLCCQNHSGELRVKRQIHDLVTNFRDLPIFS